MQLPFVTKFGLRVLERLPALGIDHSVDDVRPALRDLVDPLDRDFVLAKPSARHWTRHEGHEPPKKGRQVARTPSPRQTFTLA